jgi:4-amino-4-deoxy-L-arabinose transferase-like glycosyltransferase
MLVAHSGSAGRRPGIAGLARRIARAAERFVAGTREGVVVACALLGFLVLWTLFHLVSRASVDVHSDVSDVWMSAMDFGIGHKHPPLTAWLFGVWFAVFPRANWAVYLLTVSVVTSALGVTWRLLRDHLDANRALIGIAALALVPLYTFRAAELDENTVMMPFWAAAALFYLRARRGLGILDAVLAGAFASLAFLGKYWAIYLVAGMALTSLVGAGTRQFWRSPAPYLMAAAAALVVAPHLYWLATGQDGASIVFVRDGVMDADTFGGALAKSAYYLFGAAAYVTGPLVLFAMLRPSRAALADIAWPADAPRQQALLLLAVPLILPALVNLVLSHRLTPVWTFPNWALLPIVLYGSPLIAIAARPVARAGLVALALTLAALIASPVLAYLRLFSDNDFARAHSQQVAEAVERVAGRSVQLFWGSEDAVQGLAFYLPAARRLQGDLASAGNRAEIAAKGLVIICLDEDASCQVAGAALAGAEPREMDVTFRRTFLGFSGPPASYRIIVVPAERAALDDVSRPSTT